MKLSNKLPNKPGYYYWTNFGEHTPTIVRVTRDSGRLWADNGEYTFQVKKAKFDRDPEMMADGYYFGEELWCYIPNPVLPNGKEIKPSCY